MFTYVGLHRVYLEHSTRNEASCRVGAGAEFLTEGTKRSAGLHLDGWHDMHLLSGDRHLGPAASP